LPRLRQGIVVNMSGAKSDTFENKVADLVAVTQQLDVLRIVMLRRLTLADPQTLKWASVRQLDLIFNVILSKALERADAAQVVAASEKHFDPFLPPGPEDQQDKERWLLFDLAKPILNGAAQNDQGTTEAVLDELQADAEDEQPESYSDFGTLFDDSISRYLKRTLAGVGPHRHPAAHSPALLRRAGLRVVLPARGPRHHLAAITIVAAAEGIGHQP